MNGTVAITLPGGYWRDGLCHQEAGLRPVMGEDEAFLLEASESFSLASCASAMLVRCLSYVGSMEKITAEIVRCLTVGDREALLLHLRRMTLGDRLPCVLSCPVPACGEKMDLVLRVSDLLRPCYTHSQAWHEATLRENGSAYHVRFRLPTGGDQEETTSLARTNPAAAADVLLRRCVESVTTSDGNGKLAAEVWPAVAKQLPVIMAELDPQAELILNLSCPVCGHVFSTLFDTAAFFFQELVDRSKHLYREVHLLAFYYHWSESEIMRMTARKRQVYLNLLTEALNEHRRQ